MKIIFSKTPQERLLMGLEMMEDMRQIVLRSIREKEPGISETDTKIEFIKQYYSKDLGPERLADVIQWLKYFASAVFLWLKSFLCIS